MSPAARYIRRVPSCSDFRPARVAGPGLEGTSVQCSGAGLVCGRKSCTYSLGPADAMVVDAGERQHHPGHQLLQSNQFQMGSPHGPLGVQYSGT